VVGPVIKGLRLQRTCATGVLPGTIRAITRQGVVFHRIYYYEPFLEPLFDLGDRRLAIRYDPRDLSRIFVRTAQGVQSLRYRNLARPPMSLWELRAARRRLAAEGAAHVNEDALFEARQRNAELVANAKRETRRQRRDAERRDRGYATAKMHGGPLHPEPEPASPASPTSCRVGDIEPW